MKVIVIGSLNTDIIATGFKRLLGKNELGTSEDLFIGAGGKGRNMAQMISTLSDEKEVYMLGSSTKDPFNLWEPPIEALDKSGVVTTGVHFSNYNEHKLLPGIAMIPVDKNGNNQIYLNHGANALFTPEMLERNTDLYDELAADNGILLISLGIPNETVIKGIRLANERNIKVLLDPGDAILDNSFYKLIEQDMFLIKPNEFEAEQLSNIRVTDFSSAKQAAQIILNKGRIQNVLITHGKEGGYLFRSDGEEKIFTVEHNQRVVSTVGAGDQTMAVLVKKLVDGAGLNQSISTAIKAGTWQCMQEGIVPMGNAVYEQL